MSNAPTGRFKSKALSYVFSQSRRWLDECEKAVRHAKVAVQWGAQIALYPIYALFKASRLVGRQLQGVADSAVKRLAAASPNPKPDAPIQTVVTLLDQLIVAVPAIAPTDTTSLPDFSHLQAFIPEAEHLNPFQPSQPLGLWQRLRHVWDTVRHGGVVRRSQTAIASAASQASPGLSVRKWGFLTPATSPDTDISAPRMKVQGVATLLNSRNLVLVMPGNQILDILTPTQQRQLQARISWEIADYAYRHKQSSRRYQPVLGWAKWLGESPRSLALPTSAPALPDSVRSLPARLRALPGQVRQQLAGRTIQPVLKVLQSFPRHSWVTGLWPNEATNFPRLPGSQTQPAFGLMLDFGILRFLAERTRLRQRWKLQEPSWLTVRDLGGKDSIPQDESAQTPSSHPFDQSPWVTHTEVPRSGWQGFFPSLRKWFQQLFQPIRQLWPLARRHAPVLPAASPVSQDSSNPGGNLVKRSGGWRQRLANLEGNLRSRQPSASGDIPLSAYTSAIAVANTPDGYSVEFNPNWIEVEATAVGYVKHPLEQLLAWVDQILVWIENAAIALWAWLVQLIGTQEN